MEKRPQLSQTRICRIQAQGYVTQSDQEIAALAFGNRLAYQLCSSVLALGIIMVSLPLMSVMLVVAFLGVVLPHHPFDYFYHALLAPRMNKPRLPPRSKQLKFACTLATLWIGATMILFYRGLDTAAYISGAMLLSVAFLVSIFDYCIPSMIYNAVTKWWHRKFQHN